ncbi:predicted xylanase/chitin deacetylase [Kytococcus sedentarius DSM 20547]|uniref:Predicted xylanase/chitin deacetylase n=1 Tax=Kytococcus sedentarius (strain ATCC 14392 / DSM 20547 / JCM 11482 / CCUG 33030 / NBRC 15357 / NCTC 11040 / CCM 314 / 541) TaxID=478801 RepID=C7NJT7_KYTSD|nr:predicted xylanase/chitin deacetylase [Kytococcus sedentarius DSM 20547]
MTTTLTELKKPARAAARHLALDALALRDRMTGSVTGLLQTPRVHLLYLHAVPVHEEPAFRALLDRLAKDHEFVTHDEAVRRIRTGDITAPAVSFSFDDAFASNYRTASILEEYGTRGMFFVPADMPGTGTVEGTRRLFGYEQNVTEPGMTWAQIDELRERGHGIGSHTCTHANLAEVPVADAREEIRRAHEVLTARYGDVPHFAWPFGRTFHITPELVETVFETGHTTCSSAVRGSHCGASPDDAERPLVLLRDHVMTSWPLEHTLHLLSRSAASPRPPWTQYPQEWTR